MFHVSCICTWAKLDFYSFQYALFDKVNKGRDMLDMYMYYNQPSMSPPFNVTN